MAPIYYFTPLQVRILPISHHGHFKIHLAILFITPFLTFSDQIREILCLSAPFTKNSYCVILEDKQLFILWILYLHIRTPKVAQPFSHTPNKFIQESESNCRALGKSPIRSSSYACCLKELVCARFCACCFGSTPYSCRIQQHHL